MAANSEIEKLERRWLENPLGLTFAPLAEAYRKSGETATALETLELGLAQHPNYVPAHIVRGRCHLDSGDLAQAERAFGRVLELDPENAIALKALADLAESEGRLPEALGRLEALLEVDRNNEEARGQLDHVRELMSSPAPITAAASEPLDAAQFVHSPLPDFQLHDDVVLLSARDEQDPEILVRAELSEDELPVAEAARGTDILAGPDPLAARGGEAPLEEPVEAPESPPVTDAGEPEVELQLTVEPGMELEPTFELEAGVDPLDQPEPRPEALSYEPLVWEPEPAPAFAREPEPTPKPPAGAEPEQSPEPETVSGGEPELMVTETMAEIFLRQGHRELALAVYSQLTQRDPTNDRIAAAFSKLHSELAPAAAAPPAPPAPEEPPPVRRSDAATTGGRSVADRFAALLSAERPSVASAVHPPAFEAPRRPTGEPTRPAPESLSLSAVFGEEGPPAGPAGGPPEPGSAEPSFEQFFTPAEGSTAEVELPKSPDNAVLSSMAPEDLEQFNAWLRGLKR